QMPILISSHVFASIGPSPSTAVVDCWWAWASLGNRAANALNVLGRDLEDSVGLLAMGSGGWMSGVGSGAGRHVGAQEHADEADEGDRPRSDSDVDEETGNRVQKRGLDRLGKAEGAGGVHAQREDHAPV